MPLRYFPLHFTSFLLCSIDLEFYDMCHQFPVHCHCDSDPLASLCALKAINCFVFTLYGFYMFLQVRSRQRCQWIATQVTLVAHKNFPFLCMNLYSIYIVLFEDCKYKQHINALINLEHGTVSIASQHIREAESLHVFSLHRDKYEFHFFI